MVKSVCHGCMSEVRFLCGKGFIKLNSSGSGLSANTTNGNGCVIPVNGCGSGMLTVLEITFMEYGPHLNISLGTQYTFSKKTYHYTTMVNEQIQHRILTNCPILTTFVKTTVNSYGYKCQCHGVCGRRRLEDLQEET